ncbi:GlsB/YeaQ/YmgE family stress response membrane protein [Thiocapsa bogorovii]|uniref:GlsB/YeaQ/YmgE family stress response membrane protein n=1 Tax=Thiocapsa bogorovii TaxID=521689 RepID=UPI001E559400|nr:GlsB/YeaQ/YmgE family stress response membrane protein [Thiocapsa bogorovii]UHD18660.1 GlsB/YeaQ/YmgE family stress response membrane protein [Thiocapsa bogorovii]
MNVTSLVVGLLLAFLLIGAFAGLVAGRLMPRVGPGLPGRMAIGVLGAFIGGFLFGLVPVDLEVGLVGAPITAAIGAALILFAVARIKKH